MITHYPISNGIFGELNRLVNHTLAPTGVDRQRAQQKRASFEAVKRLSEGLKRAGIEALSDDDDGVKLRLELPGFNKDELKLSLDEGVLSIVAETKDEERSFLGKLERRLKVSDEMDVENISAKLENGILYLQIPHRAKAEPKTIKVN